MESKAKDKLIFKNETGEIKAYSGKILKIDIIGVKIDIGHKIITIPNDRVIQIEEVKDERTD